MGFIGKQPTPVPLTSSDITDGIITGAKIETNPTISGNLTVSGTANVTGVTTLSDNIVFGASSKGVHLGVTSATASNLLDDYEEGTWTPTAGDGSTTYNSQYGFYTKIGEMVHAQFNISVNSFSGSTRFAMGGLPFTSKSTTGSSGIGTVTYFNSIHTNAVTLSARNDSNTSAVYLSGTTGSGGTMANINHNVFQNGTNVFGALIYRAS